jgi:Cdc6-like AAA superfamily ATPase
MLRSPDWANWLEGKTGCIWIYGIPGAGKTVLASHLIEKIKEHCERSTTKECAYVYYYCYFGHNQEEAAPFLRWTINRLCRQADLIPTYLYKLYKHGEEPSLEELLFALEAILQSFDNTYIVTDAIDESMPRDDLLEVLQNLATESRFQKIQLLSTSRQYIDIEKVMQKISVSVSMCNHLLDEDIKLYVRSQLHSNPKFKHWPVHLREEVVDALSGGAKGM